MLSAIKNNIIDNICNNALDAVTMGYNGAISCTFKNQPAYPYHKKLSNTYHYGRQEETIFFLD